MTTVALTAVPTPANAASTSSEEEIAKKKNTDCVYFLASPLTCKKGDECEFRHSETARLNPRDCWYWVGGNCLNRDCPFRHPPIEARAAAAAAPPTTPHHTHTHTHSAKKPVPCFYFSQGYCVKGSKCQYLHGQKEENPVSTAMVYNRLDSSRPAASSDSGKSKQDGGPEGDSRKKDNVYRLQDDPKKAKLKENPDATGADIQKKKESAYTWKLSENNTPPKQVENKSKAGSRRPSIQKPVIQSQVQGEQQDETMIEGKEFASPKSLAQIREEKRGDGEFQIKGKRKLTTADGDIPEQDHSRRRLSNGSATTSHSEDILESSGKDFERLKPGTGSDEDGNGETKNVGGAFDDEDDDDFAQKLGGLFS